jgi:hypothetical protein
LVAAVSLGQYADVADVQRDWVEARLREVPQVERQQAASATLDRAAPASTAAGHA